MDSPRATSDIIIWLIIVGFARALCIPADTTNVVLYRGSESEVRVPVGEIGAVRVGPRRRASASLIDLRSAEARAVVVVAYKRCSFRESYRSLFVEFAVVPKYFFS